MTGRRVDDDTEPFEAPGDGRGYEPGDYGRYRGHWYCRPPLNAKGQAFIGVLTKHQVIEHEDRTITVSPSILQKWGDDEEIWHGWLERGAWRSC